MIKKYINHSSKDIFAIYYQKQKILYINTNFDNRVKFYLII